jgi:hypothetical protein
LDQIIYRPLSIVNPYTLVLQRNYYYRLSSDELTRQEESVHQMVADTAVDTADDTSMQDSKQAGEAPPSPPQEQDSRSY